MFQKPITLYAITLTLLSACGGGGGGGGGGTEETPIQTPTQTPPQTYFMLAETRDAVSDLATRGLQTGASVDAVSGTGSYAHSSATPSFSNGQSIQSASVLSGNYDYIRAYRQDYVQNSTAIGVSGIYGAVTADTDIGRTDTATYQGEATGQLSGNSDYALENGSSRVDANFSTNRATLTVSGFEVKNTATQAIETVGFTSYEVSGMLINGASITGGSTSFKDGTRVVDPLGSTTTSSAAAFFGYDTTTSAPDEVGGVVVTRGSSQVLSTIFAAD